MKREIRFLIVALSCMSFAGIHGMSGKVYVTAKKASIADIKRIEVAIMKSDGTTIISSDKFTQSSGKAKGKPKLFFDFSNDAFNLVRVYVGDSRKSEQRVDPQNVTSLSEIIIDSKFGIEIKKK